MGLGGSNVFSWIFSTHVHFFCSFRTKLKHCQCVAGRYFKRLFCFYSGSDSFTLFPFVFMFCIQSHSCIRPGKEQRLTLMKKRQ